MLAKSINSAMSQSNGFVKKFQTFGAFSRVGLSTATTYEKTFMASDLIFKKRAELKPKPSADHQYTFGGLTTDYMLEINYDIDNGGW